MAQHDYDLANGTGAAFRADANAALAAIQTLNSGASEPSARQAYMLWVDTSTGLLKIRNAANNGWVTIGTLASANLGLVPATGGAQANSLGSSSAPSYSFLGDTDTGAYSPGAGIYGITVNGAERTRVSASGYFKAANNGAYEFSTSPIHELISSDGGNPTLYVRNSSSSFNGNSVIRISSNRNTSNGSYSVLDYFNSAAGQTRFSVNDAGALFSVGTYNVQTANSANLHIESNGVINRSTSSRIYKTDVEPVAEEAVDVVLRLSPVRYRSLADGDNSEWSYYGLIAEEVAEQDPRLVHWGYRDEDYEIVQREESRFNQETGEVEIVEVNHRQLKEVATLKPEGVQYERVGVLTLALVQRHEARIAELEARIAALEASASS